MRAASRAQTASRHPSRLLGGERALIGFGRVWGVAAVGRQGVEPNRRLPSIRLPLNAICARLAASWRLRDTS